MSREEELYTGLCERWRNIPKITIAAVQGKCVSGGLLLCWPCDLIVASDDAQFQEVTVAMGIAGVEWFAHPWEMNPRKAKEMLLTGEPIGAEEARQLGMVNQASSRAPNCRRRHARAGAQDRPPADLRHEDGQAGGERRTRTRRAATPRCQAAFALHHLAHSHWMEVHGVPVDPDGIHGSVKKSYAEGDEPFRAPAKPKP